MKSSEIGKCMRTCADVFPPPFFLVTSKLYLYVCHRRDVRPVAKHPVDKQIMTQIDGIGMADQQQDEQSFGPKSMATLALLAVPDCQRATSLEETCQG